MEPYYSDEQVTLYHGDCREVTEWLAADALVTDPPYGIAWKRSKNAARSSKAHAGILNDLDTSVRDAALILAGDMPGLVFGSLYAGFPQQLRHILVWKKPNDAGVVGSTTGFRRDLEAVFLTGKWPQRNVERSSLLLSRTPMVGGANSPAGKTGHPHAKPTDLMADLAQVVPGASISDPFAGSGTTLVAAKQVGKRAIGVELSEAYCEIAAKRLAQDCLDFGVAV